MSTKTLKEVVKYYSLRIGQGYCCLLDASKAFDRVRFDKLFQILLQRNLPAELYRAAFSTPIVVVVENGGPSASGRHLG